MFAFIEGLLEAIEDDSCEIDVGGFGVNVFISSRTAMMLPSIGEHVKLYTYTAVREDAISLYGFLSRDEKAMYKMLISVSGVGPKVGLAVLSAFDPDSLRLAIIDSDAKAISKAQGVGAKTAQRIVLELKDKIKISDDSIIRTLSAASTSDIVSKDKSLTEAMQDAIAALTALGYSSTDSKKAILSIDNPDGKDSGELLSLALKKLY